MTFSDKYEILEPITRGRVESFIARKVATGERILACIFDCPEQKPHQPTVQWVLESFHAIAPKPPGLVIDTGQYAGTSYGYLITKLPPDDLLREWVKSYEAGQPAGIAAEAAAPSIPADEIKKVEDLSASDQDTLCGSREAHGITEAFEALRLGLAPGPDIQSASLGAKDRTKIDAAAPSGFQQGGTTIAPKPGKAEGGEFTQKFFTEFGGSQQRPAARTFPEPSVQDDLVRASASEISGGTAGGSMKPQADPNSASSVFESRFASTVKPWEGTRPIAAPTPSTTSQAKAPDEKVPESEGASAGDFTSFFSGPFNGERAQRTPDLPALPVPRAKEVGEFTEMFGSEKDLFKVGPSPSSPKPATGPPSGSDADSITGLLARLDKPAKESKSDVSGKPLPPNPWSPNVVVRRYSTERDVADLSSFKPQTSSGSDLFSPAASQQSVSSSDVRGSDAEFSSDSEPAGATRVFTTPGSGTLPSRSKLPEGPSEYTRFISGGNNAPISVKEPLMTGGPEDPNIRASVAVPMPAAPPTPSPYAAAPHPPQFPHPGGYPHMPAPAGPPVPRLPQMGGEPAKVTKVPWALILTLNGLFLLAVLLVLFFALRH